MPGDARWKLEIVGPDGRRRSVPVARDLVVGRERDVDLRLDDSSVSRKHARFYFDEAGALWIEDLGNGNGVLVDGARIEEASQLSGGAEVELGVFSLAVKDAGPPARLKGKVETKAPAEPEAEAPVAKKPKPTGPPPPAGCALRGRAGPFLNRDFALVKPVVKVGRVQDGNDIAIQDDSVSREHARFTRAGRGYVLHDLGSANGTSVNGERILERPIQGGDIVRIGTVEFEYFGPAPMLHQPLDPKKKKLLIGGGAGLFTLLLVVGVVKLVASNTDTGGPVVADNHDPVSEADRHVGMAQDERRDEHWEKALKEYQEAIRLDPINMDARKGLKEVEAEIRMKQLIDQAKQRIDVGQEEEGVNLYIQVDSSSTYFPRAQAEIQRLAALLVRRYLERCHTAQHVGDPAAIDDACGHYLNIVCNCQADAATLKVLRNAEKKLGAKLKEPWSCPPSFKAWSCSGQRNDTEALDELITRQYPDPKVAEDIRIYAAGQARDALTGLKNLTDVPGRAHNASYDKLMNDIGLAAGEYTAIHAALDNDDIQEARKQGNLLFDTDKQIMPAGHESALATQARQAIAHFYYSQGQKDFQQERYPEAFQQYSQGAQVLPGDKDINQGFIDLESKAQGLLEQIQNCQDVQNIVSMTVAGSLSNKRAKEIGRQNHCKGT